MITSCPDLPRAFVTSSYILTSVGSSGFFVARTLPFRQPTRGVFWPHAHSIRLFKRDLCRAPVAADAIAFIPTPRSLLELDGRRRLLPLPIVKWLVCLDSLLLVALSVVNSTCVAQSLRSFVDSASSALIRGKLLLVDRCCLSSDPFRWTPADGSHPV